MELSASEFNQPVFGVAMRILQFRRQALSRRTPWALREAAREIEVHARTIKRYVTFLSLIDTDDNGDPLVKLVKMNGRLHILSCAKRRSGDARKD